MNPLETALSAQPPDPAGASARLDDAIAALEGLLQVARGLVAAERPIDLAGLDQRVGRICAQALDLPPETGRMLRPRLASLLAAIEDLGALLAHGAAPDEG